MYTQTRGGTRGGAAEFKWSDVSADKDREHYLGHSINAPTGRWQKNKDVHWYARDTKDSELERQEERRKIKEAEAEAMSAALGFGPSIRPNMPSESSGTKSAEEREQEEKQKELEKEEKRRRKEEKRLRKEAKRERKERKEARRAHDRHETDAVRERSPRYDERDYQRRRRSRSRTRERSTTPPQRRSRTPEYRTTSHPNHKYDDTHRPSRYRRTPSRSLSRSRSASPRYRRSYRDEDDGRRRDRPRDRDDRH